VPYLNVDEIESALQNLAAAHPATTELITVPNLPMGGVGPRSPFGRREL
jgi:hypothetical protein